MYYFMNMKYEVRMSGKFDKVIRQMCHPMQEKHFIG